LINNDDPKRNGPTNDYTLTADGRENILYEINMKEDSVIIDFLIMNLAGMVNRNLFLQDKNLPPATSCSSFAEYHPEPYSGTPGLFFPGADHYPVHPSFERPVILH